MQPHLSKLLLQTQVPRHHLLLAEFENYLNRARQLLLAGDVNGAINELTSATAINQRSAEANKLLGVAYESKGWRDSAVRSFEMAVMLDEDNPEHLNNQVSSFTKPANTNAPTST